MQSLLLVDFSVFTTSTVPRLSFFNTIIIDTKHVYQRVLAMGVNILLFSEALIIKRGREVLFSNSPVQCSNKGVCDQMPELKSTSHRFKGSLDVPRSFT